MSAMDWLELAQGVLAAIGAASALAAALRPVVVKLKLLALRTAWRGDDAVIQGLSIGLDAFAEGLKYAYKLFALLGLNPKNRDIKEAP